ncbi:hypothetical protein [Streptomyces sp. NPDC001480]|uniref:hypothetical protein n=1 Tax=Streptomyces sp. NPDC001480 TaxID=3364577 RepID=UPI0036C1912B
MNPEESRAVNHAMPTPYTDWLILTWRATRARPAVTTGCSARAVRAYLDSRDLTAVFAPPGYDSR